VDGWGYSLRGMMGMVVVGGLLITLTYFFMQRKVVPKVMALQKVRRPLAHPLRHPAPGRGAHCWGGYREMQGYTSRGRCMGVSAAVAGGCRAPAAAGRGRRASARRAGAAQVGQIKKKKKKQKLGTGESLSFLAKSPYIRDLATLVRALPATPPGACAHRAAGARWVPKGRPCP